MATGENMYAVKFPGQTLARVVSAKGRKAAIAQALNDHVHFSCYNEGTISTNLYLNGECTVYELDEGVKYDVKANMTIEAGEKETKP